jgi:hypothetical protein
MKKPTTRTCPTCRCQAVEHVVECRVQQLRMERFMFPCGGIQKEVHTGNGNIGRVIFCGDACSCGAE